MDTQKTQAFRLSLISNFIFILGISLLCWGVGISYSCVLGKFDAGTAMLFISSIQIGLVTGMVLALFLAHPVLRFSRPAEAYASAIRALSELYKLRFYIAVIGVAGYLAGQVLNPSSWIENLGIVTSAFSLYCGLFITVSFLVRYFSSYLR